MSPHKRSRGTRLRRYLILLSLGIFGTVIAGVARADTLQVAVTGQGDVQDPGLNIRCTEANELTCAFDPVQGSVTVNLLATPQSGFVFQGWGGTCAPAGVIPNCTFDVMASPPGGPPGQVLAVSATFVPDTAELTVFITGSGQGTVMDAGMDIDCPGSCNELYPTGTQVTLSAAPASPQSVFAGWQGAGCSGTGSCTIVMNSAQSVQARFEADSDGDGFLDPSDQCPNTPPGVSVDNNGCAASQLDADGDGVSNANDQCPGTAAGELVDGDGCSASQLDMDGDGVLNEADSCPDTPPDESVDDKGCGLSQLDEDDDGVSDADDQCPETAAGESVNADGCSPSQLDADSDGVPNDIDLCPDTPDSEQVDGDGCSASQRDSDGDSVVDALDQCPDTAAGDPTDSSGCSARQLDADDDGISDFDDQCPDTPAGSASDDAGCSEVQLFTNELGSLASLTPGQRRLGTRIDEICPLLVEADEASSLTSAQRDLRLACSRLKNRDTSESQARDAMDEIELAQLPALQDYLVELGQNQFNRLRNRMQTVRNGGGTGVSVADLNIRHGDEVYTGPAVQSLFQGLLGMGASEEAFSDFGRLGVFVQGDLGSAERDEAVSESAYELDSWGLTLGADYRFTPTLFAGASFSYGEVDVDHTVQRAGTDIEHRTIALYGGWQISTNWFLDGLASYGDSDYALTRTISYRDGGGQFQSAHSGSTSGNQTFLGFNSGYTWNRGGWRIGPVASVSWIKARIDAYDERSIEGSEAWNFTVGDRDFESLRVSGGLQVDYIINTAFGVLIPGFRAAYVHETRGDGERVEVRLTNNPFVETALDSDRLLVNVLPRDDSYLDTSLNLSAQFPLGISGFFSYKFYSAYDRFSLDAYTVGLRWDKAF